MDNIKFSVITVCYNAADSIRQTIESVMQQSYRNMEYIIKDGNSTDTTQEILQEYSDSVLLLQGKDRGIYDAMNIAADHATGDYIFFLNAGDIFYSKDVLMQIGEILKQEKTVDVLYGNMISLKEHESVLVKNSSFCRSKLFNLTGAMISHQTIFAKKECFSETPFDLGYRICADRDWLLKQIDKKKKMRYVDIQISVCSADGYSLKNVKLYEKEALECIEKHFGQLVIIYKAVCKLKQNKFIQKNALKLIEKRR